MMTITYNHFEDLTKPCINPRRGMWDTAKEMNGKNEHAQHVEKYDIAKAGWQYTENATPSAIRRNMQN